jgi:hypothetical protein
MAGPRGQPHTARAFTLGGTSSPASRASSAVALLALDAEAIVWTAAPVEPAAAARGRGRQPVRYGERRARRR